jgi:hypothetical protein
MQDAELYASSNHMQRRDASIVLAAHLPVMTWKGGSEVNHTDVMTVLVYIHI